MNVKQLKMPKEFDGAPGYFREWREMFHAYLNSHDTLLTRVLIFVEEVGRRAFTAEDQVEMAIEFDLDAEDMIDCKTMLFTLLCSFTSGSVKASVRRFRVKNVFEAYRKMYFDAMRLTPKKRIRGEIVALEGGRSKS